MAKLIKLKPFFTDERGEMSQLIKENINSVLLITCKKGAIRANHYHKKDSHYSYLLTGKMDYYYKSQNSKIIKKFTLEKGDMVFTPANEIHAMKFLTDSVFLALTTEKRTKTKYEGDTTKIKII